MRPRLWVLTVGVVAAVAGCGGGGSGAGSPPVPSVPHTASVIPGLAGGDHAALLARLLPVPPGATAVDVGGSTDGTLDLDGFVLDAYGTYSAAVQAQVKGSLTDRGFLVAAERVWRNTGGSTADVQLLEFADAAGAGKEVQDQDAAFGDGTAYTLLGTTDGTDGESFVATRKNAMGLYRAVAVARIDNVYLLVDENANPAPDDASIEALVSQEVQALTTRPGVSPSP